MSTTRKRPAPTEMEPPQPPSKRQATFGSRRLHATAKAYGDVADEAAQAIRDEQKEFEDARERIRIAIPIVTEQKQKIGEELEMASFSLEAMLRMVMSKEGIAQAEIDSYIQAVDATAEKASLFTSIIGEYVPLDRKNREQQKDKIDRAMEAQMQYMLMRMNVNSFFQYLVKSDEERKKMTEPLDDDGIALALENATASMNGIIGVANALSRTDCFSREHTNIGELIDLFGVSEDDELRTKQYVDEVERLVNFEKEQEEKGEEMEVGVQTRAQKAEEMRKKREEARRLKERRQMALGGAPQDIPVGPSSRTRSRTRVVQQEKIVPERPVSFTLNVDQEPMEDMFIQMMESIPTVFRTNYAEISRLYGIPLNLKTQVERMESIGMSPAQVRQVLALWDENKEFYLQQQQYRNLSDQIYPLGSMPHEVSHMEKEERPSIPTDVDESQPYATNYNDDQTNKREFVAEAFRRFGRNVAELMEKSIDQAQKYCREKGLRHVVSESVGLAFFGYMMYYHYAPAAKWAGSALKELAKSTVGGLVATPRDILQQHQRNARLEGAMNSTLESNLQDTEHFLPAGDNPMVDFYDGNILFEKALNQTALTHPQLMQLTGNLNNTEVTFGDMTSIETIRESIGFATEAITRKLLDGYQFAERGLTKFELEVIDILKKGLSGQLREKYGQCLVEYNECENRLELTKTCADFLKNQVDFIAKGQVKAAEYIDENFQPIIEKISNMVQSEQTEMMKRFLFNLRSAIVDEVDKVHSHFLPYTNEEFVEAYSAALEIPIPQEELKGPNLLEWIGSVTGTYAAENDLVVPPQKILTMLRRPFDPVVTSEIFYKFEDYANQAYHDEYVRTAAEQTVRNYRVGAWMWIKFALKNLFRGLGKYSAPTRLEIIKTAESTEGQWLPLKWAGTFFDNNVANLLIMLQESVIKGVRQVDHILSNMGLNTRYKVDLKKDIEAFMKLMHAHDAFLIKKWTRVTLMFHNLSKHRWTKFVGGTVLWTLFRGLWKLLVGLNMITSAVLEPLTRFVENFDLLDLIFGKGEEGEENIRKLMSKRTIARKFLGNPSGSILRGFTTAIRLLLLGGDHFCDVVERMKIERTVGYDLAVRMHKGYQASYRNMWGRDPPKNLNEETMLKVIDDMLANATMGVHSGSGPQFSMSLLVGVSAGLGLYMSLYSLQTMWSATIDSKTGSNFIPRVALIAGVSTAVIQSSARAAKLIMHPYNRTWFGSMVSVAGQMVPQFIRDKVGPRSEVVPLNSTWLNMATKSLLLIPPLILHQMGLLGYNTMFSNSLTSLETLKEWNNGISSWMPEMMDESYKNMLLAGTYGYMMTYPLNLRRSLWNTLNYAMMTALLTPLVGGDPLTATLSVTAFSFAYNASTSTLAEPFHAAYRILTDLFTKKERQPFVETKPKDQGIVSWFSWPWGAASAMPEGTEQMQAGFYLEFADALECSSTSNFSRDEKNQLNDVVLKLREQAKRIGNRINIPSHSVGIKLIEAPPTFTNDHKRKVFSLNNKRHSGETPDSGVPHQ